MGDTFPRSFSIMDLRVNQTPAPRLATTIQELGRLCRYVSWREKMTENALPSVLVGKPLYNAIERAAARDDFELVLSGVPADGMKPIPRSKSNKDPRAWYCADEKHCDFQNETEYHNRFLLQAEPQVGKTGAYLCLLGLLKQVIEPRWLGDEDLELIGTSDDYSPSSDEGLAESNDNEDDYPSLQAILAQQPLVEQQVLSSKYGSFQLGAKPSPLSSLSLGSSTPMPTSIEVASKLDASKKVALPACYLDLTELRASRACAIKLTYDGPLDRLEARLPERWLQSGMVALDQTGDLQLPRARCADLQFPIFTPSYRRAIRARLMFSQVMEEKQYLRFVFVRAEEFAEYHNTWGGHVAIVSLPRNEPQVATGGIGYCRFIMHLAAYSLGCPFVWMLDDNVRAMGRAVGRPLDNGLRNWEPVSFYQVLSHMERQVVDPAIVARSGDPNNWGVLGMARYNGFYRWNTRYTRRHVYSAMLVNVQATWARGIRYRADWAYWEDLRFNCDCDSATPPLLVVKYMNFLQFKDQIRDWRDDISRHSWIEYRHEECSLAQEQAKHRDSAQPVASTSLEPLRDNEAIEFVREFIRQNPDEILSAALQDIESAVTNRTEFSRERVIITKGTIQNVVAFIQPTERSRLVLTTASTGYDVVRILQVVTAWKFEVTIFGPPLDVPPPPTWIAIRITPSTT